MLLTLQCSLPQSKALAFQFARFRYSKCALSKTVSLKGVAEGSPAIAVAAPREALKPNTAGIEASARTTAAAASTARKAAVFFDAAIPFNRSQALTASQLVLKRTFTSGISEQQMTKGLRQLRQEPQPQQEEKQSVQQQQQASADERGRRFGGIDTLPIKESGSFCPNPIVFLDISIGGRDAGRILFQLFADTHPITAENFRCLCTGETGLGYWMRPRWYKHCPFHRIIPGFMCQGGDIHRGDGRGGESIYGQFFRDERHIYKHCKRGLLAMAKTRWQHSSNSQFFITFAACPWLNGEHVVFGQVIGGDEVLDKVEEQGTIGGWRKRPVEIYNCGELYWNTLRQIPADPAAARRHTIMLENFIFEPSNRPEKLYEPKEQLKPIPDDVYIKARHNF